MLNVTEPDDVVVGSKVIAKSFSDAETPPVVPPGVAADVVVSLLQAVIASANSAATHATAYRFMEPPLRAWSANEPIARCRAPPTASQVDAGAELGGRWLGPRLHSEGLPAELVPVDPEHQGVRALRLEHETVQVECEGRRALALRRREPCLERGALSERSRRAVRAEQRDRQGVRAGLGRVRPNDHPEPDTVVPRGERARLDHAPAHPERVELAVRGLDGVRQERLDLHQAPSAARSRSPRSKRSNPNSNCSSAEQSAKYRCTARSTGNASAGISLSDISNAPASPCDFWIDPCSI